jgi:hypothetical protein
VTDSDLRVRPVRVHGSDSNPYFRFGPKLVVLNVEADRRTAAAREAKARHLLGRLVPTADYAEYLQSGQLRYDGLVVSGDLVGTLCRDGLCGQGAVHSNCFGTRRYMTPTEHVIGAYLILRLRPGEFERVANHSGMYVQ